jgi:hypothetical protein
VSTFAKEDFMSIVNVDDLLGNIDDLLGPAPTPRPGDLGAPPPTRKKNGKRKYEPLKVKNPAPNGIFAAREKKGKNLGRTCLIDGVELKHKGGRPPVICRKKSCFRAYRNLYRHDYDRVR